LVTPKAQANQELMFDKPALVHMCQTEIVYRSIWSLWP